MNPGDVVALTPSDLTDFILLGLFFLYLVWVVVFIVVMARGRKGDDIFRAYHTWNPELQMWLRRAGYILLWPILGLLVCGVYVGMSSGNMSSDLLLNIASILLISLVLVYMVIMVL
jgi:hypothetical protein